MEKRPCLANLLLYYSLFVDQHYIAVINNSFCHYVFDRKQDCEAHVGGKSVGRHGVRAEGARQLRGALRVPGVRERGREDEEPFQARPIRCQTGRLFMQ